MNSFYYIDVSFKLSGIIPFSCEDIESLDSNITSMYISSNSANADYFTVMSFSRFNLLEVLEIGDDCFMYVNEFVIDGLNKLKSVVIGMNSFTLIKSNEEWDINMIYNGNRSFHILNCDELESIEIGSYSFSDYGGLFELKNLPHLNLIEVGDYGFYASILIIVSSIYMN